MPHQIQDVLLEQILNLHNNRHNLSIRKRKKEIKKILNNGKENQGTNLNRITHKSFQKVKNTGIQFLLYWKIENKWESNPLQFGSLKAKKKYLKKLDKKLYFKKTKKIKAKREALKLLYKDVNTKNHKKTSELIWTANKIDCVELAYALHAAKVFNHGKAELIQIIKAIQVLTNLTIIHPNRMFIDIQNRKKEQTKFLNELTTALENRIIDIEAK